MGRLHPEYCEHGKCVFPGDDSFGCDYEDCRECMVGSALPLHPYHMSNEDLEHAISRALGLVMVTNGKNNSANTHLAKLMEIQVKRAALMEWPQEENR